MLVTGTVRLLVKIQIPSYTEAGICHSNESVSRKLLCFIMLNVLYILDSIDCWLLVLYDCWLKF